VSDPLSTVFGSPAAERAAEPAPTASSPSAEQAERLRSLAAQFEAMLLGQMLREMRSSMFEDGDETGFGGGPLADTLWTELSLALGRAGGFGLADAMRAPLARQVAQDAGLSGAGLSGTGPLPVLSLPSGPVSSGYGWRPDPLDGSLKLHKGTDIALPEGHPVRAASAGRVEFAGELAGYGKTVVVSHEKGLSTRYAHLSQIDVRVGDPVSEGQLLARSGATGRVSGAHLHFEVLDQGRPVDPRGLAGTFRTVTKDY
jgi:murein DD-endopeptidase MepM/ murein hydrolase activator NlpD